MDLRTPIAGLFSIFGVMLTLYGVFGPKDIYAQSPGINVQLWWGLVMLVFGSLMYGFAWVAAKRGTPDA